MKKKKYNITLEIRHKNGSIDLVNYSIIASNKIGALKKLKKKTKGKYKGKEVRYKFL